MRKRLLRLIFVHFVVYTSMLVYIVFIVFAAWVKLGGRLISTNPASSAKNVLISAWFFQAAYSSLKDCHQSEIIKCASIQMCINTNYPVLSCDALAIWRIFFGKNNAKQARHADFWLHSTMYFMGCCWWLWSGLRSGTFQINGARIWWRILHVRSPTSGQFRCSIWRWFLVAVQLFLCQTRGTCFHRRVALENEQSFPMQEGGGYHWSHR